MIVIAGWLRVRPAERDDYLAGCRPVVEQARATEGCVDFAIDADLVDDSRINVFEIWQDELALLAFRGSGPEDTQQEAIFEASVQRYEIASEGPA